jgi:Methyltransferase domain
MEEMPKTYNREYLVLCQLDQAAEHDDLHSFPTNGEFYTLWDFWLPAFTCPHKVERIGTLGDGGKYMCGLERLETKKDCVVYSVGEYGFGFGTSAQHAYRMQQVSTANHLLRPLYWSVHLDVSCTVMILVSAL